MFTTEINKEIKKISKVIDKIDTQAVVHLKRSKEIKRRLLMLEKNIYQELMNTGSISDDNAHKLISEVDDKLDKYD